MSEQRTRWGLLVTSEPSRLLTHTDAFSHNNDNSPLLFENREEARAEKENLHIRGKRYDLKPVKVIVDYAIIW